MTTRVLKFLRDFPELNGLDGDAYNLSCGTETEDSQLPEVYDFAADPFATREDLAKAALNEAKTFLKGIEEPVQSSSAHHLPGTDAQEEILYIPCEHDITLEAIVVNEVYMSHLVGCKAYPPPPPSEKGPLFTNVIPISFIRQSLLHIPFHESPHMTKRFVARSWPGNVRASHVILPFDPRVHETGSVRSKAAREAVAVTVAALKIAGLGRLTFLKRICQNRVATCFVGFKICLHVLSNIGAGKQVTYEPVDFPGAIIRHPDLIPPGEKGVTLLAYSAGALICVGSKSRQELIDGYRTVFPWIYAARAGFGTNDEDEIILAKKYADEVSKRPPRERKRKRKVKSAPEITGVMQERKRRRTQAKN